MLGIAGLVPLAPDQGWHAAAGVGGQDSDGASRTGSYQVTPPSVVRAGDAVRGSARRSDGAVVSYHDPMAMVTAFGLPASAAQPLEVLPVIAAAVATGP
jgi:hypothetical protein